MKYFTRFCTSAIIVIAGCSTATEVISESAAASTFRIPSQSESTYEAPDGRTWVLHESGRVGDAAYFVTYTPVSVPARGWTEMLQFRVDEQFPEAERVTRLLEIVKAEDDPELTFALSVLPDGYILSHRMPSKNEAGISRTVRGDKGATTVSYQCRLTSDPVGRLQFWTDFIKNLPNEPLQPTAKH